MNGTLRKIGRGLRRLGLGALVVLVALALLVFDFRGEAEFAVTSRP